MYRSKHTSPLLKFLLFSNQNENKSPLHSSRDTKMNNEIDNEITVWENFPEKPVVKFFFFDD